MLFVTHSLTLSLIPAALTSLLSQPWLIEKQTPSPPVPLGREFDNILNLYFSNCINGFNKLLKFQEEIVT